MIILFCLNSNNSTIEFLSCLIFVGRPRGLRVTLLGECRSFEAPGQQSDRGPGALGGAEKCRWDASFRGIMHINASLMHYYAAQVLDQLDQHFSQGSGCEFRFIEAELDLVAGDSSIVTCLATNFGGRGGWLPIGQSRDCNSLKVTTYRTTSIYVYRSCADIRFYQLNHSFTKQQDWTITFPTHLQCLD